MYKLLIVVALCPVWHRRRSRSALRRKSGTSCSPSAKAANTSSTSSSPRPSEQATRHGARHRHGAGTNRCFSRRSAGGNRVRYLGCRRQAGARHRAEAGLAGCDGGRRRQVHYSKQRWDLVVACTCWYLTRNAKKIVDSLKPGGMLMGITATSTRTACGRALRPSQQRAAVFDQLGSASRGHRRACRLGRAAASPADRAHDRRQGAGRRFAVTSESPVS